MKLLVFLAVIVLVALGAAAWSLLPKPTVGPTSPVAMGGDPLVQAIRNAGYPCDGIVSSSSAPGQPATVICSVDGRLGGASYVIAGGRVTPG